MVAASPMGRSDEEPAATLEAIAAVLPSASCHVAGLNPTSFRCAMTAACVWCAGLNSAVRDLSELVPKQVAPGYGSPTYNTASCPLLLTASDMP